MTNCPPGTQRRVHARHDLLVLVDVFQHIECTDGIVRGAIGQLTRIELNELDLEAAAVCAKSRPADMLLGTCKLETVLPPAMR